MELAIQRVLNEVNWPTGSGDMALGAEVICKLKLWTAAILNLCKLTTFPVSKSWRLFICLSEGPNKQVKAKKPSIAICSKSSPTLTGLIRTKNAENIKTTKLTKTCMKVFAIISIDEDVYESVCNNYSRA